MTTASAWFSDKTGVLFFSQLGDSVTVVTGLIFIACVMVLREGLSGVANKVVRRVFHGHDVCA